MLMNNEFDWVAQLAVLYNLLLHVYHAIFSLLYPADNYAQENTGNTLFQSHSKSQICLLFTCNYYL